MASPPAPPLARSARQGVESICSLFSDEEAVDEAESYTSVLAPSFAAPGGALSSTPAGAPEEIARRGRSRGEERERRRISRGVLVLFFVLLPLALYLLLLRFLPPPLLALPLLLLCSDWSSLFPFPPPSL
eukprot:1515809-Pyramimonas_sp.AAC.1